MLPHFAESHAFLYTESNTLPPKFNGLEICSHIDALTGYISDWPMT